MKGGKECVVGHGSIVEAVQLWLDGQYKEGMSPRVVKVEAENKYSNEEFKLTFAQPDENKVA